MSTLREILSGQAEHDAVGAPTRFRTPVNRHALYCADCGGLFYADDQAFRRFRLSVEASGENPFRCDDCEEGRMEEEHGH